MQPRRNEKTLGHHDVTAAAAQGRTYCINRLVKVTAIGCYRIETEPGRAWQPIETDLVPDDPDLAATSTKAREVAHFLEDLHWRGQTT